MTPETETPQSVERLTSAQFSDVLGLVEAATGTDGVAPLSEAVLLAARDVLPDSETDSETGAETASETRAGGGTGSRHVLSYAGTQLAGYAHLDPGPPGAAEATGEMAVDPSFRRLGIGTALLRALENALPEVFGDSAAQRAGEGGRDKNDSKDGKDATLNLWAHGNPDAAQAFALRDGYSKVRELWQMHRPLRADVAPLPAVSLPEGFRSRHFVVGQDEEAWLQLNARAFAHHPEQGRMTRADLDRRIAEPWFDAEGLILIEDVRGRAAALAASHWTKVVRSVRPGEGEVYVVGVDPAYQGLGLGRTVTVLGLEHVRDEGLDEAMLYVDADNDAAVATYSRLDFARTAVDIMYSRTVHLAV